MAKIIKILGIIALIGTFFLAFWLYRLGILNDSNALKDLVQRYRLWGRLFYCRADHTDCFSCDSWRPYDSCRF